MDSNNIVFDFFNTFQVLFPSSGSYNGSELTKEMFRWDQRLFTVLLRIPGIISIDNTNVDDNQDPTYDHFSSLCEYSGGMQCIVQYYSGNLYCRQDLAQLVVS